MRTCSTASLSIVSEAKTAGLRASALSDSSLGQLLAARPWLKRKTAAVLCERKKRAGSGLRATDLLGVS